MRDASLYLTDILSAMDAIELFVDGMDFEQFRRNDLVSSAVIRKFEVIGEAVKHLPEGVKQRNPDVPWKEMAGMRDRLIHFYFGLKYELVWQTIKDVIPAVRPMMKRIAGEARQA